MKKFAIGCLVVLALAMVVGGVGLYFAYDRLIKPGMELAGGFKDMAKIDEMEKQVRNTGAFAAPESGELTEEMVNRFVKVQQHMQAKLGTRMSQLKTKYDQLNQALEREKRDTSFREVATALKDLGTIIVEGKSAQVEALNQAGFSVKEYEWVRQQVYAALGMVAVGFDVKAMAEKAKAGDIEGFSPSDREPVGDVPERNKALVAPHEKQLKDWAALAFFGL